MAATLTSTACQTFSNTGFFINPPRFIEEGLVLKAATYTGLSATASVTAVLQMVPIPKGVQVHDCILQWKGLAGTSLTISVGDNNNNSRFIQSASCTAASGVCRMGQLSNLANAGIGAGGFGYSYSAENTINVYITANGSGSSAAALNFRLAVLYSADNNQKG